MDHADARAPQAPDEQSSYVGLNKTLDICMTEETPERVRAEMPIVPEHYQPWGFLHGGATIALLESVASRGAELRADLVRERPFGIEVHVRHWKSGTQGTLHGTATFDHEERNKQYWHVEALDDEGDIISDGTIVTKIVTLERLAEKAREREAVRNATDQQQ